MPVIYKEHQLGINIEHIPIYVVEYQRIQKLQFCQQVGLVSERQLSL